MTKTAEKAQESVPQTEPVTLEQQVEGLHATVMQLCEEVNQLKTEVGKCKMAPKSPMMAKRVEDLILASLVGQGGGQIPQEAIDRIRTFAWDLLGGKEAAAQIPEESEVTEEA